MKERKYIMKQLTVKQLYLLLAEEVKNGNGDKTIVVADDNEGNAYHGLFYGITSEVKSIDVVPSKRARIFVQISTRISIISVLFIYFFDLITPNHRILHYITFYTNFQ